MRTMLAAVAMLSMPLAVNSQTCGNGIKVDDSSCCLCEKGFAPPDCTQCLPGYLLGTDAQGVQKCYDGVTDCHDLLPAPWGCGGKGRCVGCAPGVEPCYPKCECNPGVSGNKCEGQATAQCTPESVHMYTVFPQQPVANEDFNVHLWGCSIDGSSEYQIVSEDTPCGVAVDDLCTIDAGDKLEIRYEQSKKDSDMQCNTCGECTLPYAWELLNTDSKCGNGTSGTTITANSLAECMGKCEKAPSCQAVNYVCTTGMCTHYKAACEGSEVPGTEGAAMWKIKDLPAYVNTDASKGCSACNTDAAGETAECLTPSYDEYWKPTSLIAACDGAGGAALQTVRNTDGLKGCLALCRNVPECTAVDWFCQTKSCILYNAPCASPGAIHHGASSYELLPTQPSNKPECSQCGECPDQLQTAAAHAASISTNAACEVNDEGIVSYKESDASTLARCIDDCRSDAQCKAFDWFCQVRQCKLYREACTVPKATYHGANSYRMVASGSSRGATVLAGVTDAVTPGVTCASMSKKTGKCYNKLTTFQDAKNTCAAEGPGWRLCYMAELETGVCCNTGCAFGSSVVWMLDDYSKSSGRSCPAMGQTQKACPSDAEKTAPLCEAVSYVRAVACCSKTAAMCYTTKDANGECYGKYSTFKEAEKICSDDGKRLCTLTEVNDGLCCGRGCSINSKQIWTSEDGQKACTNDQLAGVFANPAGMFDGCPQQNFPGGKGATEQCMEAKNAMGSVRCCYEPQPVEPTPEPTAAPNTCTGTAGQVRGSIVKNSAKGCFVISSRKDGSYWEVQGNALLSGSQQGAESVRLVAPFSMPEVSCSVNPRYTVQSHPNFPAVEPCSAGGGACPTCTAAIESCDKPGMFLKLDGGRITFEAAPADACGVFNETGCAKMSACRWQTVGGSKKCVTLSRQEFGDKATFKVYLHKEFTNYTTFESMSGHNIVPDNGAVVGREAAAANPGGAAWLMREIPGAKTSSEAVLPGLKVTGVPAGGAKYKICQKRGGVWAALQTHTDKGYRTMTFDVVDLDTAMRGAPSPSEEGCCNGIELFDICIPWWVFLLLWLCCLVCAGGLAWRKNQQDKEAVRNNTQYDEFELDEKIEEQGKTRDEVDDDV